MKETMLFCVKVTILSQRKGETEKENVLSQRKGETEKENV